MAEVLTWAEGLTWAAVEGLDRAEVEGLDRAEVEVLIGVEVEGSTLISSRLTIAATGMRGVVIGFFLVILIPDLNGNVSDGAGGWPNGIKKSVVNMASMVMLVIWGNRATMACISVVLTGSSIKIKWSNLFIQIKFNLYR